MSRTIDYLPRIAIFLAGIAAGALTGVRRERRAGMDPAALQELKSSLANLETRMADRDSASVQRFTQIEARLEEHATKLSEVPSTAQIVAAMEQLLSKTMSSLDDRLTSQAHSIEVLKTTVSQTDSLLERVLESLDSLQTYTDPAELSDDMLLHRPAV
jgi:antitoxin component HigA of HigAB toxin-antitoxin module